MPKMDFEFGGKSGLYGSTIRIGGMEDVEKKVTHESLHAVLDSLGIPNTTFTEALVDVLSERQRVGLWFGQETFLKIKSFLEAEKVEG
jgi:hypothetical protein